MAEVFHNYFILLLQVVTEDQYDVSQDIEKACIVIKNTKEPPLTLTIHLTSPLVREEMERAAAGGKAQKDCVFLFFFWHPYTSSREAMQTG